MEKWHLAHQSLVPIQFQEHQKEFKRIIFQHWDIFPTNTNLNLKKNHIVFISWWNLSRGIPSRSRSIWKTSISYDKQGNYVLILVVSTLLHVRAAQWWSDEHCDKYRQQTASWNIMQYNFVYFLLYTFCSLPFAFIISSSFAFYMQFFISLFALRETHPDLFLTLFEHKDSNFKFGRCTWNSV